MPDTYLVAKYIPDLVRREPQNVGVMLRHDDRWYSRFLGENGEDRLDRRRLKHLAAPEAYVEWHRFWVDALERGVPCSETSGTVVPDDPAFAEQLCAASADNFLVEPGPPLGVPADLASAQAVLSHLFARLVSRAEHEAAAPARTWAQAMRDILGKYGLEANPHFKSRYSLQAADGRVTQTLFFPYAYEGGELRLYKRLEIEAQHWESENVQRVVNDVLWSFQLATRARTGIACVALMYAALRQARVPILQEIRQLVGQRGGKVVDLCLPDQVDAEFRGLRAD